MDSFSSSANPTHASVPHGTFPLSRTATSRASVVLQLSHLHRSSHQDQRTTLRTFSRSFFCPHLQHPHLQWLKELPPSLHHWLVIEASPCSMPTPPSSWVLAHTFLPSPSSPWSATVVTRAWATWPSSLLFDVATVCLRCFVHLFQLLFLFQRIYLHFWMLHWFDLNVVNMDLVCFRCMNYTNLRICRCCNR